MARPENTVKVWVRTRPTSKFAKDALEILPDMKGIRVCKPSHKVFKYDGVMHSSSQEEVFATVAKDLINSALKGHNGLIMCYGQTGAGKTYTMTGMAQNYNNRGLIPRSMTHLFEEIDRLSHTHSVQVQISYLEIYEDSIYDLLSDASGQACHKVNEKAACGQPLEISETPSGVYVKGLSYHTALTVERAFNFLFEGEANRVTAAHSLNHMSSRSHCIFTTKLEVREAHHNKPMYKMSELIFVDLAGSEKVALPKSANPLAIEAIYTNKSLAFLEQVFQALANDYSPPYRQCKLTHYLRGYIGGQCLTHIIANIWAELPQLEETVFTLQVAQCIKSIPMEPVIREIFEANICRRCCDNYKSIQNIPKLKKELQYLATELAFTKTSNTTQPVSQASRKQLAIHCQNYLEGTEDNLTVSSFHEAAVIFQEIKEIFRRKKKGDSRDITEMSRKKQAASSANRLLSATPAPALLSVQSGKEDVAKRKISTQKGLGGMESPDTSGSRSPRPRLSAEKSSVSSQSKDRIRSPSRLESAKSGKGGKQNKGTSTPSPNAQKESEFVPEEHPDPKAGDRPEAIAPPSREAQYSDISRSCGLTVRSCAFEEFKKDKGKELYTKLLEYKTLLQEKKELQFTLSTQINKTKREIDQVRETLRMLSTQREREGPTYDDDGDILISHAEFLAIKQLKALKITYHASCVKLREVQVQKEDIDSQIPQCRKELVNQFEKWLAFVTTAKEEGTTSPENDLTQYAESLQEAEHRAGRPQYPHGSQGTGQAIACPKHPIFPLIPRTPPGDGKFAQKQKEVFKAKDSLAFYNSKSSIKYNRVVKAARAQPQLVDRH